MKKKQIPETLNQTEMLSKTKQFYKRLIKKQLTRNEIKKDKFLDTSLFKKFQKKKKKYTFVKGK